LHIEVKRSPTFSIKISIKLCINYVKCKVAISIDFLFLFAQLWLTAPASCCVARLSSFATLLELGDRKNLSSRNLRDTFYVSIYVFPSTSKSNTFPEHSLSLSLSLSLSSRHTTRSSYLYSESDSCTSAHYRKTLLKE